VGGDNSDARVSGEAQSDDGGGLEVQRTFVNRPAASFWHVSC
jgi:hypothetical protein